MVLYQIAIVDMDIGESASPVFHLSVTSFTPEDSIFDAFVYFCSATFHLVVPGMSDEGLISRGLKHARFFGIEKYGRQQRRIDVRTFDILWNDFCSGFDPLIDVTFFLQPKASIAKPGRGDTGALFHIFLSPIDKKIALQQQESNQRGTLLPLLYSEWCDLSSGKSSHQPYVEVQWNSTVELLFGANGVLYKMDVVQNADHCVYKFITLFSLLLTKLNFRWSKIIKIDSKIQSCSIFAAFFPDSKRPYSANDEENNLNQEG